MRISDWSSDVCSSDLSYDVYNNFLSTNEIENYGGSAQIDYDLGNLALTSITAYRQVRADTNQDSDFPAAALIGEKSDYADIDPFPPAVRLTSDFDGPINLDRTHVVQGKDVYVRG